MIKDIGGIFRTAYALRTALVMGNVPDKDNVVICIPFDTALGIYSELEAIASRTGSDRIEVAVNTRSGVTADNPYGGYTKIQFDRPPAPHPGASEPWMCVFDIEVFAV